MFDIIYMIVVALLVLWMVVETDERYPLVVGAVAILLMAGVTFWSSWTFSGLWTAILSGVWLKQAACYLLVGMGWFLVEFVLRTRRAKSELMELSANLFSQKDRELIALPRDQVDDVATWSYHRDKMVVNGNRMFNSMPFSFLEMSDDMAVKIDGWELTTMSGFMLLFSPFYIVNFVTGRLIREVASVVSAFVRTLFGGAVTRYFSNFLKF